MVPQIETVGLKLLLSFGYFQSTWFITFTAAFLQWSLDKFYFLLFFFFLLRGLIWIHHVPYLQWTHWTGPLYELCWKLDLNGRGDWVTLLCTEMTAESIRKSWKQWQKKLIGWRQMCEYAVSCLSLRQGKKLISNPLFDTLCGLHFPVWDISCSFTLSNYLCTAAAICSESTQS